ncbi:MAG: 16S rRNA C967 or C1407 C5-methylase (RsmB/RsmF family) [Bradymonadia bacterium]|jgi:16S rRNA C967 or C1407 C5-methylase (RsmB/RsmF family)
MSIWIDPAAPLQPLDRYAPLVGDVDAFLAATDRPLPRVIWANPLRDDLDAIAASVLRRCPEAVAVPWRPYTWRLPPQARPGIWPRFIVGDLHGQEEAAILAAELLDAQPGETILDMCAAPGGKSAIIATAMRNQGTLIANDRKASRLASLRRTLERLGITCAGVSRSDGVRLQEVEGGYDRIMVDAPCTCEGTSRKADGHRGGTSPRYRNTAAQIQVSLLRHAVKLVKPGGRIVYATCTYAPEENEAVIDSATIAGEFVVCPIPPIAGVHLAPGVTEWNGRSYRDDVRHAARLWPHQNDTGGFFAAVLERRGTAAR